MAKKNSHSRKPSGAAAIQTIDGEVENDAAGTQHESNGSEADPVVSDAKPKHTAKAKTDQSPKGHVGIGDIKKAAAFANSIGGLDKAIALLQILKIAKEVQ
jgi:hypothetical protein